MKKAPRVDDVSDDDTDDDKVPYVAFTDFRSGLPLGRFRVVVNPELARTFVTQRLNVLPVTILLCVVGLALVFTGSTAPGGVLVFAGVIAKRVVQWQAPKILLHLASRNAAVYGEVTSQGILEVRRAI
jgi:hypothetical protein